MKPLLLIAALLAGLSQTVSPPPAPEEGKTGEPARSRAAVEKEIRRMEREFAEAVMHNDMAAYDRLLADEHTFTDAEGVIRTKPEVLAELVRVLPQLNVTNIGKYESIEPVELDIQVEGNKAVVKGRMRVKGYGLDHSFQEQHRFTRVWVKRDGRWQLVSNQVTRIE